MFAAQIHLCQDLEVVAAGSWGGVGRPLAVGHLQDKQSSRRVGFGPASSQNRQRIQPHTHPSRTAHGCWSASPLPDAVSVIQLQFEFDRTWRAASAAVKGAAQSRWLVRGKCLIVHPKTNWPEPFRLQFRECRALHTDQTNRTRPTQPSLQNPDFPECSEASRIFCPKAESTLWAVQRVCSYHKKSAFVLHTSISFAQGLKEDEGHGCIGSAAWQTSHALWRK